MVQAESATVALPESASPKKPFRKEGLGYVYEMARSGIVFRAQYITRSRDTVSASISVDSTDGQGQLFRGKLTLESPTSQRDVAKHLATISGRADGDIDKGGTPWLRMVQSFAASVLKAEDTTVEVMMVGNLPARERPKPLIEKLLSAGKPMLLYGDSSAGKGWIATSMCVCLETGRSFCGLDVRTARVLYLDWEDDEWSFNERIRAISDGLGVDPPNIAYIAMRGQMARHFRTIARLVEDLGIDVIVIDSVGLAAGTVGERGSYEDVAIGLFDQLRLLPAAVIMVDHVNASDRQRDDGTPDKSLGSVYKRALVRSQWFVRKVQDEESLTMQVGLFQTKSNHSSSSKPIALTFTFENDDEGNPLKVSMARVAIRDVDAFEHIRPSWERISDYLGSHGPTAAKDLDEALDLAKGSARVILNRYKKVFTRQGDRWALLYREAGSDRPNVTPIRQYRDDDFDHEPDKDLPF